MKLTIMNKTIQIQIPEGKVAEWKEINGVTTLVLTDEKDNRPITERIKTFEDAVKATGMTLPFDDNQLSYLPKDVVAYMKLRIIAAALNGLTEDTIDEFPKFTTNECRFVPWFYLYTQEKIDKMEEEKKNNLCQFRDSSYNGELCGFVYGDSISGFSPLCDDAPARLSVKSERLAKYFGQQFIEIWADYLIGKS